MTISSGSRNLSLSIFLTFLDKENADFGDASPTEAMTLDSSPTEASINENFATGDAKPTDSIMLDESSKDDWNGDDNKGIRFYAA